jgi:hypothetical protein
MSWLRGGRSSLTGLAAGAPDVGLAVFDPRTQVQAGGAHRRDTVELPLPTVPMPAVRPHPQRRYPPAVPSSAAALSGVS